MASIREFHDFKGEDVVLLWMTREDLRSFLSGAEAEICLTDGDAEQFEGLLNGLLLGSEPGHQYMDIDWPVGTLMISVDEYPDDFGNDR